MKPFLIAVGILIVSLLGFGLYRQANISKHVVVVYSPHPSPLLEAINKQFEEKYPDIQVQLVHGATTQLEDRVRSERANPMGDVIYGGDVGTYIQLKKDKLLKPMILAVGPQIPAVMKDPDGCWHAPYKLPGVFFYNKQLVSPENAPQDWNDLLKPEWKADMMFLNPTQSGTARTFYIALIDVWGEEKAFDFFKKMDEQLNHQYVSSSEKLFGAISRGEAKVGLWHEAGVLNFIHNKKMPFEIVYPASGTYMNPEPIAIIANAPHPDAAQKYVEFVFEEPTLEFAAHFTMKRPTREDFPLDKLPVQLRKIPKTFPIDWTAIGDKGNAWLQKWNEEVWYKKF